MACLKGEAVMNTLFFSFENLHLSKLGIALRHNERERQDEINRCPHIDPDRTHLNYRLFGNGNTEELLRLVQGRISDYELNTGKKMRHDAIPCLEVLFSWPSTKEIGLAESFFVDCLEWAKTQCHPAVAISAVVHHDESSPHMHVIFLCVTRDQLLASRIKGYKAKFKQRQDDFFATVGQKYGLYPPPPKLNKTDKVRLADTVRTYLHSSSDPVLKSTLFPTIWRAIEANPVHYAQALGIEINPSPRKMRTLTQIMTSKGKGSNCPFEK